MKVLITGNKGFIGKNVTEYFEKEGIEVIGFDLPEHNFLDLENLKKSMDGVDVVIHLGAIGDVYVCYENPTKAVEVNVLGTAKVLQACKEKNIQKVIYISTWEVMSRLDHPYNITKYAGELLANSYNELYKLPVMVVRFGTAYGNYMRDNAVIPKFIQMALKGETITIQGDGSQYRQFTHTDDISAGLLKVIEKGVSGKTYLLVSDEKISIKQLAELLTDNVKFGEARPGDVKPIDVDTTQTKNDLGWEPKINFKEGLEKLKEKYKSKM